MARLTVIDGPDLGSEFELPAVAEEPCSLVIGRDPDVDVPLRDGAVSREHCRLRLSRRGCRVADLGSRNRTFLNGDPVEEAALRDGDVLRIGDTELRYEGDAPAVESVASTIIRSVDGRPKAPRALLDEAAPAGEESTERYRETIARIETLLEISSRLERTRSPAELLAEFLAELSGALRASAASFLAPRGRDWIARASWTPAGVGGPARPVASLAVVERAQCAGEAVFSRAEGAEGARGEDGGRAYLAAPVFRAGEIAGVVHVEIEPETLPPAREEETLEFLRRACAPLGARLERIADEERLADENRNLLRSIADQHRIIGSSPSMVKVFEFIERAAPTDMTVLVEGETGTGKELVARAVHYASPRRGRPLVAVNCAALPEALVESELFGHEKGAFTGALRRKKGRFELAHTGTLLLDEIGDLGLPCQAKLLRLLEQRCFERVGGTETIGVDVRIIAASNRDLLEAVSRGEFREDLYYRLGVLAVTLPPLRERPEDIPPLVDHFLARAAVAGRGRKLAPAALRKLESYSWPGNVRQLRNVIESATVLADGSGIRAKDLVLPDPSRGAGADGWRPISLQELEREHVLKVLEHTGGNKKRAAEILGIERCTLYSKLKIYDT